MKTKAHKPHYVDNKKFLEAMIEYRARCTNAEEQKESKPDVTNYIGECFLKIANHLSYRPNFINYTYRDDMISDGIEKEKKQMQIKSKLIANIGVENMMDQLAGDDKQYQSQLLDFLQRNFREEEPTKK